MDGQVSLAYLMLISIGQVKSSWFKVKEIDWQIEENMNNVLNKKVQLN